MVIAWDFPVVEFGAGPAVVSQATPTFTVATGDKRVGYRARRPAEFLSMERRHRSWQAPYVNDESQAALVSRHAVQRTLHAHRRRLFLGPSVGSDPKPPRHLCASWSVSTILITPRSTFASTARCPLLKFWPDIDKDVLREFAETVPREYPEMGLGGRRRKPASRDSRAQE